MIQIQRFIRELKEKGFDVSKGDNSRTYIKFNHNSPFDIRVFSAIIYINKTNIMFLNVVNSGGGYTVTTEINHEKVNHGTANSQKEALIIIKRALGV